MMMEKEIRLMIVDDERLIRNLLKKSVRWQELGVSLVGEAESAEQAIVLAKQLCPELVITDICMSNLDGVSLADQLIQAYPKLKVVILTGYDNFEYAKRSISAGVSEYLLKPIDPKEIRWTVLRLKEEILQERRQEAELNELREQLERDRPHARRAFLQNILLNRMEPGELPQQFTYFGLNFSQSGYQAGALSVERTGGSEEACQLLRLKALRRIEESLQDQENVFSFLDITGRIVILSFSEQVDLEHCCAKILEALQADGFQEARAGVGNAYQSVTELPASYQQAVDALEFADLCGKKEAVCYDEVAYSVSGETQIKSGILGKYEFYLKAGMEHQALACVGEYMQQLDGQAGVMDQRKTAASVLMTSALDVVSSFGLEASAVLDKPAELFSRLFSLGSSEEIAAILRDSTIKIIDCQRERTLQSEERLVSRVKSYITDNLAQSSLSLTTAAETFHLSTGYLSRSFKKETGMNFIRFLLKERMERAVELLKTTDLLGYQVGEAVGIPDSHYFSICFKKYTGISASDYKKECRYKI